MDRRQTLCPGVSRHLVRLRRCASRHAVSSPRRARRETTRLSADTSPCAFACVSVIPPAALTSLSRPARHAKPQCTLACASPRSDGRSGPPRTSSARSSRAARGPCKAGGSSWASRGTSTARKSRASVWSGCCAGRCWSRPARPTTWRACVSGCCSGGWARAQLCVQPVAGLSEATATRWRALAARFNSVACVPGVLRRRRRRRAVRGVHGTRSLVALFVFSLKALPMGVSFELEERPCRG